MYKIVSSLMVCLMNFTNTIPAVQAFKRFVKQVKDDDDDEKENLDDNSKDGLKRHYKHSQRTFLGYYPNTIIAEKDN